MTSMRSLSQDELLGSPAGSGGTRWRGVAAAVVSPSHTFSELTQKTTPYLTQLRPIRKIDLLSVAAVNWWSPVANRKT